MRTVRAEAPARVALAGNPSDGYGGRTLSLAIGNFGARVSVRESEWLEIVPAPQDRIRFANVDELVGDVRANGYYGGLRLLKATVMRIGRVARERGLDLGDASFSIAYETSVPRGVGLGGSSAIVTAAVKALCEVLDLEIPRSELPALILSVETEELGIAAGLQDRVAQVYGGLTYMDFDPSLPRPAYESLDPGLLPPLFVAHLPEAAEPSGIFHADLRGRFDAGEPAVREAMSGLAELATRARKALEDADEVGLGEAMGGTFEARRSIGALDPRHVRLIELAREHRSPANYAGSGGAIVGLYRDDAHLTELEAAFRAHGIAIEPCHAARGAFAN